MVKAARREWSTLMPEPKSIFRTTLHRERIATMPLFVSLKAPYERLQIGGVESRLRELGKRLSLPRVHPHKFRRTLATMAIDKGMPVEQLQRLLGHQRIDTTCSMQWSNRAM